MEQFNPDAFLGEGQPASPGTAQPQAEAGQPSFDPDAFSQKYSGLVDENTGEAVPLTFSGLSPETAKNKSVVSGADRFKLSMGNLEGNISYLKSKFKDVRPIPDAEGNLTEELAVQHEDGSWYRVDPKNGDIADPWEKTKEYVRDIADLGPIGIGVGVGAAAAGLVAAPAAGIAAVTGGALGIGTKLGILGAAGLAGGAASGAIRTSLGRAIGTYEATPEQQAKDVGFEALLNAAGIVIPPGVKPGGKWVAGKLDAVADAFKDTLVGKAGAMVGGAASAVANAPKNAFKQFMAGASVGVQHFDFMLNHTPRVKAMMNVASQKAGNSVEGFHTEIVSTQRMNVENFANTARHTLSQIYGAGRNKILAKVRPDFAANFDEPVIASYRNAIQKGIGVIELDDGTVLAGKEALEHLETNGIRSASKFAPAKAASSRTALPGQAGDIEMTQTAKGTTARFRILSKTEMHEKIKAGSELSDDLGYLASNDDAHKTIAKFYKEMARFADSAERKGPNAARDLIGFKRVAADMVYDFSHMDHVANMPGVKKILDDARHAVTDSVFTQLNGAGKGLGKEFMDLNGQYEHMLREVAPILRARQQAIVSKSYAPYEAELGRFLSNPGKNVTNKQAIDAMIDAAEANGMKAAAKDLTEIKLTIQAGEAAKRFNPLPTKGHGAEAGLLMTAGIATASTGNPLAAATLGGVAANMTRKSPKTAAMLVGMYQTQQFLAQHGKHAVSKVTNDPKAMSMLVNGLTSIPQIYDQTEQVLSAEAQRVLNGQGQ